MDIVDGLRDGAAQDMRSPLFLNLDSSYSKLEEALGSLEATED